MPKLGMEPLRRKALVDAAISEIGAQGSLDVTVGRIARRAGVSSALAHHYFGGKDDLLLAAMGEILRDFGRAARDELRGVTGPEARVGAVVRASFAPRNYRSDVVAAWLNFYVQANRLPQAERLLAIYHRRMRATLSHAFRPALGARAGEAAETVAALIDGIYLRQALGAETADGTRAEARIMTVVRGLLTEGM